MTNTFKNTNTAKFKQIVWAYLADCAYDDAGEYFNTRNDDHKAMACYLYERFDTEYNYSANKQRYPGLQNRVKEWLSGLAISVDYTYGDIIDRAGEWHDFTLSAEQGDKVCENWFNFLAFKLIQLWRYHDLDTSRLA